MECAAESGQTLAFIRAAYASQDSLGLLRWATIGQRAGIVDTASFEACARTPGLHPRIQQGLDLAQQLEVTSTPTVMVHGLRFGLPPSKGRLFEVVDSLLGVRASR